MWVFDNNCFHTSALFRKTLLAHFSRKFFRWFIPSLRSMSWKGVPLKMHEYFSFENIWYGTLCWDPKKQKENLWSFPRIPFYAFLCLRPDWRRGNLEKAHWCHRATNRDFWPSCSYSYRIFGLSGHEASSSFKAWLRNRSLDLVMKSVWMRGSGVDNDTLPIALVRCEICVLSTPCLGTPRCLLMRWAPASAAAIQL